MFTKGEKIGPWDEHLDAKNCMLNSFAAIDYINYLRKVEPLWLYEQYCKSGHGCIRWSKPFWEDPWLDLVIEQCMIKSPNFNSR